MFAAAMVAVLLAMALALVRAVKGPDVFDRILGVNVFGTNTVLFIAVMGFLTGRPDWLDVGLVYALMNFIGILAVLKFIKYGGLGEIPPELEESP